MASQVVHGAGGRRGGSRGGGKQAQFSEKRLGRVLCYYLRHSLDQFSDQIGHSVNADEVVEKIRKDHSGLERVSIKDLEQVVETDEKGRYRLFENNRKLYIGCCQGHNQKFKHLVESIGKTMDAYEMDWAIHGTKGEFLGSILSGGLKTMSRSHIHFTRGITITTLRSMEEKGTLGELRSYTTGNADESFPVVRGGARQSANVLIVIDCRKAMEDAGILFTISENDVVLSTGRNGKISPQYFKAIIDVDRGVIWTP